MDGYNLHDLYKEFYFHELEVREKITTRIQITFAFHATLLTLICYILRMIDYESSRFLLGIVFSMVIIVLYFLVRSVLLIIKAFWGNTYEALASGEEIEKYRVSIEKYAVEMKDYQKKCPSEKTECVDVEKKISSYLYSDFSKCATHNSKLNDKRSENIHDSVSYLLKAFVPFLVAAFCFVVFDMDASSPRKSVDIELDEITSSINKLSNDISETLNKINEESIKNKIDDKTTTINMEEIMSEENNENKNNQEPTVSKPEEPTPPPVRLIKESANDGEKETREK